MHLSKCIHFINSLTIYISAELDIQVVIFKYLEALLCIDRRAHWKAHCRFLRLWSLVLSSCVSLVERNRSSMQITMKQLKYALVHTSLLLARTPSIRESKGSTSIDAPIYEAVKRLLYCCSPIQLAFVCMCMPSHDHMASELQRYGMVLWGYVYRLCECVATEL